MRTFAGRLLPILAVVAVAVASPPASGEAPAPAAPGASLVVSGGGLAFAPGKVAAAADGTPDYEVLLDQRRQTLAGFGGAFNEKGWEALGLLPESERAQVLDRIFTPGAGLGLDFCRIPIGASDYALSRYTLDDGPEDLSMERFSLARDRQALIPYIKAAQARNPRLRFWGSAWTPPPWMKTDRSFDGGFMVDEPEIYRAYALYLARFVEEYAREGIPVEAVAVQNEPVVLRDYPSCGWDPHQYVTFVADHLGPTLRARRSPAGIVLGTFNTPQSTPHAMAVLRNERARSFVKALGLQWDGLPIAEAARRDAPGLPIWHTETDCGNHNWEPGFDPEKPQNDFAYGLLTWRKMRLYLAGGAELYTLWNIVLDEQGKSIDAKRPWPQNAPVVVDRASRTVRYTPMYYSVAHISRYAGTGAVVLGGKGSEDALAFLRADGRLAVAVVNPAAEARTFRIKVGARLLVAELPGQSFATLLVEP